MGELIAAIVAGWLLGLGTAWLVKQRQSRRIRNAYRRTIAQAQYAGSDSLSREERLKAAEDLMFEAAQRFVQTAAKEDAQSLDDLLNERLLEDRGEPRTPTKPARES